MNLYDQLHGGILILWSALMFFGVTRSTVYREDWWLSASRVVFPEGQTRWVVSNLLYSLFSFVLAITIDGVIKGYHTFLGRCILLLDYLPVCSVRSIRTSVNVLGLFKP